LVWLPLAAAKNAKCVIINPGLDQSYADLQTAHDAAATGATLWVRGVCTGTTTISKNLTITGQQPKGFQLPTLDGERQPGRVLTISGAIVTVNTLTITGGADGGIRVSYDATVTVNSSTVSRNTSLDQGGGINNGGWLTLNNSSVTSNTATFDGGGIYNTAGLIVDHSIVSGNTATSGGGGGIASFGSLTLNDRSSITRNAAPLGGGVFTGLGPLTLNGNSTISGNTAGQHGGGIYMPDSRADLVGALVAPAPDANVYGNAPDNVYRLQRLVFTSTTPSPAIVGASYTPSAVGFGSGLLATITLDAASSGCSMSSGVVTFTAPGACLIDANQAGNEIWGPADQVQQAIIVRGPN